MESSDLESSDSTKKAAKSESNYIYGISAGDPLYLLKQQHTF